MENLMKRFFRSSIISSIILIALGLLLIFQSEATIMMISYVIGGILIAIGVLLILFAIAILIRLNTLKQ